MTSLTDLTATTAGLPCRTTDPEIFFSKISTERETAKGLCVGCPIRTACAQYAIDNPEMRGVWGGTTAADRRSFRDGQPWQFDEEGRLRLACGSERAYRAHFAYREDPCDECRAAHEAHIEENRRARLAVEHAAGGSAKGWWIHRRLGEASCEGCRSAFLAGQALSRQARARRGHRRVRVTSVAPGAAEPLRGPQAAVRGFPVAC